MQTILALNPRGLENLRLRIFFGKVIARNALKSWVRVHWEKKRIRSGKSTSKASLSEPSQRINISIAIKSVIKVFANEILWYYVRRFQTSFQMRPRISIRGFVRPPVCSSVRRSLDPVLFLKCMIVDIQMAKSTKSDEQVEAPYGPPRSLFFLFTRNGEREFVTHCASASF